LASERSLVRIVGDIEKNPLKAGLPAQYWPFVKKCDGGLPGQVKIVRKARPRLGDS
jgi:hypothetical protein